VVDELGMLSFLKLAGLGCCSLQLVLLDSVLEMKWFAWVLL
jgi:hypothetical protein